MDSIMDVDEDPEATTERFAIQTCPTCEAATSVPLSVTEAPCERCGAPVEVAPLPK